MTAAVRTGERTAMPWAALTVLSLACFTAVATETLPVGLLPRMAADLRVSPSRIGLLVSIYAVAVVIASIPLNAWTQRFPRRPLLLILVAGYGLSNLVLCLAPGYSVAAAARLFAGVVHALFFAVLFGYGVALAPKHRTATAITIVGGGSGVAIAVGTPLGTLLANLVGWRGTFAVVAVLAVIMVVVLRVLLPPLPGSPVTGGDQLRDVVSRPAFVWLEIATVLMVGGVFAAYTFAAPILIGFGWSTASVGAGLLIFGAASLAGRFGLGGLADRHGRAALTATVVWLAVIMALIALVPAGPVVGTVAIVVWGLGFGPLPTYLQVAIIRAADGHTETASAIHNSVFNIGIAGGAFLGAQVVAVAHPAATGWLAAGLLVATVPVMIISWRRAAPVPDHGTERHGDPLPGASRQCDDDRG